MDEILYLARKFHSQSIWREAEFNEEKVRSLAGVLVSDGGVFINSDGGFVAGTIQPLLFSTNTLVAVELAWFAPNGGGRELREAFEEWARSRGVALIQLCLLGDDNFDKNHENMRLNGYALAELQYVKAL